MGFDGKKKIITIASIEAINKKGTNELIGYNITEKVGERDIRYAMWLTRAAKETEAQGQIYPSAAALEFKSQGMGIGSTIGIAYVEEANEYEYKDKATGEMIQKQGTNNTIRWFARQDQLEEYNEAVIQVDATPAVQAYVAPQQPVDDMLNVEDIPF